MVSANCSKSLCATWRIIVVGSIALIGCVGSVTVAAQETTEPASQPASPGADGAFDGVLHGEGEAAITAPTCQHTIGPEVGAADGADNYADVRPGETVCITAGSRAELTLKNFRGGPDSPITFINAGGVVEISGGGYAGVYFRNSEYVRLTGTGMASQCGARFDPEEQHCGIRITEVNKGIAGKERTGHIVIDHVEIADAKDSGIAIHDQNVARGEWTQNDTGVHHTYIHDVEGEGMYLGSSYYARGLYHELKGVEVAHNLVLRTGRDGIQVGSAVERCAVHHNRIAETGRNGESSHLAGIMNNGGSVCDLYNNWIADTGGWGAYLQGNGGNRVYNNVIVRAGRLVSAGANRGAGVLITTGTNVGRPLCVWDNIIIAPAGDGILYRNDAGIGSVIQNNVVASPGGTHVSTGGRTNVTVSGNVVSSTTEVVFSDPTAEDLSGPASSACVA